MSWLLNPNPKITHKDISFKDYLNVKSLDLTSQGKGKINPIEVVLTKKNNPDFKIEANMKNTECKIKGVLISNPICAIPKIPFLTNFWQLRENQINLFLSSEIDYLDQINKDFNINLTNNYRNYNYGRLYNDSSNFFDPHTNITLNSTYSDYINFLQSSFREIDNLEIKLILFLQKFEKVDFFFIFDFMIQAFRGSRELEEFIKDQHFSLRHSSDPLEVIDRSRLLFQKKI
jgi:hypothetical protein